ncbi:dynein-1-beta heavy chain, flagellar inner arm I1 complex-like isoform X1 [Vespa crabro]|uniref:dynein-1-beta heavy chain, flagellar inner arm I1 complex-like isoform X1 n=1 Tax=Vespa crabro TaxID=7445 RepID=UPI001F028483|nr:dynein-1-beta heavy chain, flagellar inner arm I1 complex-like isoform X1 [Vespa crabro]
MESKKEKKQEKLKKTEKVISDPHREYLDMDTDEEGHERRETSESEYETSPEPENPIYTEQELITLVQYVKDLTVLSHLKESDWNESCYEVIREYFQCVSHTILIIFFNQNKLMASLNLSDCKEVDLMYFLRSPLQIYTTDNFLKTIFCGNINEDKTKSFFKFLQNIYAPVALNSNEWPEIIQNDLYLNLHNLLMILNEQLCKSINRTILYIPRERLPELRGFRLFYEHDSLIREEKNTIIQMQEFHIKELIGRLEKIVRCWIKQIHAALTITVIRKNIESIMDECNHWKNIYDNLNSLNNQLSNNEVQAIIQLLKNMNSSSVESFPIFIRKLQETLMESSSNLIYLNILSEYCTNLCISDNIEANVTKILLLILLIWVESPFYSITNNIGSLCRALSTQLISQCQRYIDIETAIKGHAESGIHMLEKSISTCQMYRKVYEKFVKKIATSISPYRIWDIDEEMVFNSINAFIQRCQDIIEICNARIIFERCAKEETFGGAKGIEYEKCCQQIENLFYDNLNKIIAIQENILNIKDTNCNVAIHKFKIAIIQLENMIKNLINHIFENIKNIDEGIEAIYAFERFKYRSCLKDLIYEKWIQMWKILDEEIEICNITKIKEIGAYHPLIKSFSKYLNVQYTKKYYLKMQYTKMMNASYWLVNCVDERYSLERYNIVIDQLEDAYTINKIRS